MWQSRQNRLAAAALALCLMSACLPAHADVFVLQNGAQIRGKWLNQDQQPLSVYVILTECGGKLTLRAEQISRTIAQNDKEIEYEQKLLRCGNVIDHQWQLAQWCRANELEEHRKHHLQRIIAIDPDHEAARHALGYSQVRGKWTTRSEFQRRQGYEFLPVAGGCRKRSR